MRRAIDDLLGDRVPTTEEIEKLYEAPAVKKTIQRRASLQVYMHVHTHARACMYTAVEKTIQRRASLQVHAYARMCACGGST